MILSGENAQGRINAGKLKKHMGNLVSYVDRNVHHRKLK